jgi:hypothetical protein
MLIMGCVNSVEIFVISKLHICSIIGKHGALTLILHVPVQFVQM